MPSREASELALLLLRKAQGDDAVLDKLLQDRSVPDEVLGFHLQQAVEKRLKAALVLNDIDYERTHSISYLTALQASAIPVLPAPVGACTTAGSPTRASRT